MAFPANGVVEAPEISLPKYGIFCVAKPESSVDEDRWIRGFSQEWDSTLYSAKLFDDTDTTSSTLTTNATPTRYAEIKPFFIEVEDTLSTLGFLAVDRFARLKRQVEAVTEKAVERELWVGPVRKGETHDNRALSSSSATVLNAGAALSAVRALALLDHKIADTSPVGERGVIHITRDVASLLSSDFVIFRGDDYIQTISGTPVVVGSGYTGVGPDGDANAAATDTNKWIYATGSVKTYVGEVDVVNDNFSQAYNVSGNQNDMKIKAIRPAAVYFSTSVHLAVRVNLAA
jgi:hypothetical protein